MMVENIVTVIAIFSLGVGSLGVLFGALGLLRLGTSISACMVRALLIQAAQASYCSGCCWLHPTGQ